MVDADQRAPAGDGICHHTRRGSSSTSSNSPGDAPLERGRDGVPEIVGREDAVGARDVVEHEAQVHTRGFRVGVAQQQIGAVGAQEAGELVDCRSDTIAIDHHAGAHHGLALHRALTEARQTDACRLPSPPHTIGTI